MQRYANPSRCLRTADDVNEMCLAWHMTTSLVLNSLWEQSCSLAEPSHQIAAASRCPVPQLLLSKCSPPCEPSLQQQQRCHSPPANSITHVWKAPGAHHANDHGSCTRGRTLLFRAVTSISDSFSSWLMRFALASMPTTQLSVKEFVASASNLHHRSVS